MLNKDFEYIKTPLWDLMLSTNDCFPGCSCENDYFDISSEKIKYWILENDINTAGECLKLLDNFIYDNNLDYVSLSRQTNIVFENNIDAREWLNIWRMTIYNTIKDMELS